MLRSIAPRRRGEAPRREPLPPTARWIRLCSVPMLCYAARHTASHARRMGHHIMSNAPLDLAALKSSAADLERRYEAFKGKKLTLDMTRGKPCSEQLDLAERAAHEPRPRRLQRRGRHRLPQLRRPRRPARGEGALRRVPGGGAERGARRRQLEPRADARHGRARAVARRARRRRPLVARAGQVHLSDARATIGTSPSASTSASRCSPSA